MLVSILFAHNQRFNRIFATLSSKMIYLSSQLILHWDKKNEFCADVNMYCGCVYEYIGSSLKATITNILI